MTFNLANPRKDLFTLLLFLAVAVPFSSLIKADYLNWDDPYAINGNDLVYDHSITGITKIFSEINSNNRVYIPLTMLSFNIEHWFVGFDSSVSHFINIALHLAIVMLLFRLGRALNLSQVASFLGALVFAIHPIHVESVAWLTERKDGLYGAFYIASLLFYVYFLKKGKGKNYILSLLFAALSVLSKPMALSLPLVLFLIDWMMARPLTWKSLLEKIPFFLVVEPVVLITLYQNQRPHDFLWPESLIFWLWCPFFYIQKFFWPTGLSPFYMVPVPVMQNIPFYLSGILIFVLLCLTAIRFRASRWVPFGLLFYVFSAFFLWRIDGADPSILADRFMYLPSAGLCLFLGWGAANIIERLKGAFLAGFVIFLIVIAASLMFLTYKQTSVWLNSWNMWTRALSLYPDHAASLTGRAEAVMEGAKVKGTGEFLRDYILQRKLRFPCGNSCGVAERHLPALRFLLAIKDLKKAIKIYYYKGTLNHMAYAYLSIGDLNRARNFWAECAALSDEPLAYQNLGLVAERMQDYDQAIKYYTLAIVRLKGAMKVSGYLSRGMVYFVKGDKAAAWKDILSAYKWKPYDANIVTYIGILLEEETKFQVDLLRSHAP